MLRRIASTSVILSLAFTFSSLEIRFVHGVSARAVLSAAGHAGPEIHAEALRHTYTVAWSTPWLSSTSSRGVFHFLTFLAGGLAGALGALPGRGSFGVDAATIMTTSPQS